MTIASSSCTDCSDRHCIDAARRSVQSSTDPGRNDGFPDRRLATRDGCPCMATIRDMPLAMYSRFVQRVRRRYAARARRCLPPGVPDRAAIVAVVERLQAEGSSLVAALRIARQLTLERLCVLDVEESAPLADITLAMTELAEATLEIALERTLADQDERFGVPRDARRRAHRLLDRRHGQARRARAQRLVRHRPRLRLRRATARPTARAPISAHEYFSQVARGLYALIGDVTEDGFVFRVDLALRPNGNSGPPVTSLAMLEDYLQAHGREWERFAWLKSRVVAPRASVASGRALALRSLVTRLRLPPLPRLRRLRGPAPAPRQGARRSAAARRRPARARQRRQAVARRHPRDRVHRPAAAGRSRRPVPRDPHPLDAEGDRQARRRRPDEARRRRSPERRLHAAAPRRAPHPVPRRPADARAADRRRRSRLDRAQPRPRRRGRHGAVSRPALHRARVRRRRVRPAPARRPRAGGSSGCRTCGPAPLPVDAEDFLAQLPAELAARVRPLCAQAEDQAAARREQGPPRPPHLARRPGGPGRRAARRRRRSSSSTGSSRCCAARATSRCSPSGPRCRTGCCACSAWRAGRCAT